METRINVAKILANCPSGMELDCAMFNDVYFDCIEDSINNPYPIRCYRKVDDETLNIVRFSEYGAYTFHPDAKCIIFPKNNPTWEGFTPPCEFKDGDIVAAPIYLGATWIGIFKQYDETDETTFGVYCSLTSTGRFNDTSSRRHVLAGTHLATEEEKQKLLQVIKKNGYKWDAEKKCLEKLAQYPKTYKECCAILGLHPLANDAQGYKSDLIIRFQELIIYRDAYWMLYSEQMRLDYFWQPDYRTGSIKFCIRNIGCKFEMTETIQYNTILAFPTAEMRDAFYENFREDIERCSELL